MTEEQLRDIINDAVKNAVQIPAPGSTTEGHIKGIKGLSEFLKVSHSRAQALKNSGIFPHFQTGRLILFDPAKVRAAMAEYQKRGRRVK